jgi:hypothetical protein
MQSYLEELEFLPYASADRFVQTIWVSIVTTDLGHSVVVKPEVEASKGFPF